MAKKKILVVQFRTNDETIKQDKECYRRRLEDIADIFFLNAMTDGVDWEQPERVLQGIDGIILGGSSEYYFDGRLPIADKYRKVTHEVYEKMRPFLKYIFEKNVATLGAGIIPCNTAK